MKNICLIGAFDVKDAEYAFVRQQILDKGHKVISVNAGVLGTTEIFPVDIEADKIAEAGGSSIVQLREKKDRGEAMKVMSAGAAIFVRTLYDEGKFDGIMGMGGSGGTSIITAAMRVLPIGVPKVCVSTVASSDVSGYVGTKDITMIPSIVDVAGINRISKIIFTRAASAICGMVETDLSQNSEDKPVITASMFGNTTECVNDCMKKLTAEGYEVLVFHCTGVGGMTMESLVKEGLVDAVLDITTTEWASANIFPIWCWIRAIIRCGRDGFHTSSYCSGFLIWQILEGHMYPSKICHINTARNNKMRYTHLSRSG